MATIYAQRSSAVRAAKKACGPDQEWTIQQAGEGFTFTVLDINEKQPAPDYSSAAVAARVAEAALAEKAIEEAAQKDKQVFNHNTSEGRQAAKKALEEKMAVTTGAARTAVLTGEGVLKPFQLAKKIVSEMVEDGITSRKEIIAACLAAGIKYNTADGAHYELCVRKS